MISFRERLKKGIIISDGAMGTMIYSRGVYINQCFDALNISNPDLIRQIHKDYIKAGSEIIETNTFGANFFKLKPFGLEEQLYEFNVAGAQIAREVAEDSCYVAGSMGPIGKPLAPLSKISNDEVFESFAKQAKGLEDGGCDVFILETFSSLAEIELAIDAVRTISDLPIIAQMTFSDETETRMGETPEQVGVRLSSKDIDVVGANCSQGPSGILEVIERLAPVTSLPLSAQPNAGLPKIIEGRFIYLSSPEYMAEYAKRLIQVGVTIIGGCCGSNPSHIKAIASAVKALRPKRIIENVYVQENAHPKIEEITPTEKKSPFSAKLGKKFIRIAEVSPPRGVNPIHAIEVARMLKEAGFDAVNVPDGPRASARMSPLALAYLIKQNIGYEVILHYCCRDRNILGMQSDLLGMHALGLRNLLIITGDPPKLGDYPDATAVFDVDSIGLVRIIDGLNHGYDLTGKNIGESTEFLIGVGANPGAIKFELEIERLEKKIKNGAEMILTQPVFNLEQFHIFLDKIKPFRRYVIMGLLPLVSYRNAQFLHNEVPGMSIPLTIREKMKKAGSKSEARQLGIDIARNLLEQVKNEIDGVYVMPPLGHYKSAIKIFENFTV